MRKFIQTTDFLFLHKSNFRKLEEILKKTTGKKIKKMCEREGGKLNDILESYSPVYQRVDM
jgi:transposase